MRCIRRRWWCLPAVLFAVRKHHADHDRDNHGNNDGDHHGHNVFAHSLTHSGAFGGPNGIAERNSNRSTICIAKCGPNDDTNSWAHCDSFCGSYECTYCCAYRNAVCAKSL
jgi:hypothetical protein